MAVTPPVKLVPPEPARESLFGYRMAVNPEYLVVGASGKSTAAGESAGAAYVYAPSAGSWTQLAELEPEDARGQKNFGTEVALDGDTLVVASGGGGPDDRAAAYVFVRNGNTWQQQAKLWRDDVSGLYLPRLAVRGNTLLASDTFPPGISDLMPVVLVFERSGGDWREQTRFMGDGSDYDLIGVALQLTEDQAFVATRRLDDVPDAVFVFDRSETNWTQSEFLRAENGTPGDRFGEAMVVTGDELLIGAPFSDELTVDSGAVYVFRRESGAWRQTQVLVPWEETGQGIAQPQRWFGNALASDGTLLLVGAPGDRAVYVLRREQNEWVPARKIWDRWGEGGAFGMSVALRGRTALVGSPDEGRSYSGAVFAFELKQEDGESCTMDADCVSAVCGGGVCVSGGEGAGGASAGAGGDIGGAGEAGGTSSAAASGGGMGGSAPGGCGCSVPSRGRGGVSVPLLLMTLSIIPIARKKRRATLGWGPPSPPARPSACRSFRAPPAAKFPAPPLQCPRFHPESSSDFADFRAAPGLAARVLPELAVMTDGHATSIARRAPLREASIRDGYAAIKLRLAGSSPP